MDRAHRSIKFAFYFKSNTIASASTSIFVGAEQSSLRECRGSDGALLEGADDGSGSYTVHASLRSPMTDGRVLVLLSIDFHMASARSLCAQISTYLQRGSFLQSFLFSLSVNRFPR